MSPIPSVTTAFSLSTATPSIPLDPDSAGQSASAVSQYLIGTGGFVFAIVAIVSVAGYFYHGRGAANGARKNSTWATISGFLSSMRHRGSDMATMAPGTHWAADVELGFEHHVSMVYARYFHPTSWNLVECHPGTSSAPEIYVEDEASEIAPSEPKPYGMNSFLDVDDEDEDDDGGKSDCAKGVTEDADQGTKDRVARVPPYDTNSGTNVSFKSKIIGTTNRPGGAFLYVPGQERGPSDTSSQDGASQVSLGSVTEISCSPYDGIATESAHDLGSLAYDGIVMTLPMADGGFETSPHSETELVYSDCEGKLTDSELAYYGITTDSQLDLDCLPFDGILTTPLRSTGGLCRTMSHSDLDLSCSPRDRISSDPRLDDSQLPYDGILRTPSSSTPNIRRYGMADMADLAQSLKYTIPRGSGGLLRTISHRGGLCDLTDFDYTDSDTSCRHSDPFEGGEGKPVVSSCDISVHDIENRFRRRLGDASSLGSFYEGEDLMRRILEDLRDPNMDCTPRSLSEYSDSEYAEDNNHEASNGTILRCTRMRGLDSLDQLALGLAPSTPRADSDTSDEGSIYPVTPPLRIVKSQPKPPSVHKVCVVSQVTHRYSGEVQVVVPTFPGSPPLVQSSGYVRTHWPNRPLSMVYGPPFFGYLATEAT